MQAEIDTSKPHAARIYDYLLGGKDHFAIDRETAEKGIKLIPTGRTAARENRAFLGRAVRYLVAEAGIRQFLDIGTGLPSANNVHEVAQAEAPESRVVYVDNDPIVLAHARALLTSTPQGRSAFIDADLCKPDMILGAPALRNTLDLSKPVGNEGAQLSVMWRHFKRGVDQKTAPPFAVVHRSFDDLLDETADGLLRRQRLFESLDSRPRRVIEITLQRLHEQRMLVAVSVVETRRREPHFVGKITYRRRFVAALPEALDRRL